MSNRKSDVKKALKEADELFEREGLTEKIRIFLESEMVKALVQKHYTQLKERIAQYEATAPESLKKKAADLREDFSSHQDLFEKDVFGNFKLYLVGCWEGLRKMLWDRKAVTQIIRGNLDEKDSKSPLLEDMEKIAATLANMIVDEYIEILYTGYVPEGMPEEVSDIIGLISFLSGGKGVVIPATAVFPELMDEKSDEEKSEEDN